MHGVGWGEGGYKFAHDITVMVSWTSNISMWTFGTVFFWGVFSLLFARQGLVHREITSTRTKLVSLY